MKLWISSLIAAFLLLSIPAAATAQKLEKPGNQQQLEAKTSAKLTDEIQHQLITLPYYGVFDWLEFRVLPDYTVILNGSVTRDSTRSDAEARVKKLEGVRGVENQIEILPLDPNDAQLRRALYTAVYRGNGPLFQYAVRAVPPIHIIVKNGHVTLKGVVDNDMDKQLAFTAANAVPNVFDVHNDLIVQK